MSKFKSLFEVYTGEVSGQPVPPVQAPVKKTRASKQPTPDMTYDEVIQQGYQGDPSDLHKITAINPPTSSTTTHIPAGEINKRVWEQLFFLTPPRKGEVTGSTKGSGNGELALYWFLKKNGNNDVRDTRYDASGAADLMVGGMGVEVKSYPKAGQIKIGKFKTAGKDIGKKNNITLNNIIGIHSLVNNLTGEEGKVTDNANFSAPEITRAFETTKKFYKVVSIIREVFTESELSGDFAMFRTMGMSCEDIFDFLGGRDKDSAELTRNLLWSYAATKLNEKPGPGGFIVNVQQSGSIEWLKVPEALEIRDIPATFKSEYISARTSELFIDKRVFV